MSSIRHSYALYTNIYVSLFMAIPIVLVYSRLVTFRVFICTALISTAMCTSSRLETRRLGIILQVCHS